MVAMERRKSAIDLAKQRDRIERARRMLPEDRLQACINLSSLMAEFRKAQKQLLKVVPAKPRS
jgi:hypothetical protein